MLSLAHYLVLGAILFAISIVGIFLNRRNVIIILMAIELMLLAVNTNFVAFSHYLGDIHGQIFVFFVLTIALAPLAGSLIAGLFGWKIGRKSSHRITILGVMISFVLSCFVLVDVMQGASFNATI